MHKLNMLSALVLIAFGLVGCYAEPVSRLDLDGGGSSSTNNSRDDWWRSDTRGNARDIVWDNLPNALFSPVSKEHCQAAIERLAEHPFEQIQYAEAQILANDSIAYSQEKVYILARGLVGQRLTGGFRVEHCQEDNSLYVSHSSLGKNAYFERWPIVIAVDKVPSHIFVTYSVAE